MYMFIILLILLKYSGNNLHWNWPECLKYYIILNINKIWILNLISVYNTIKKKKKKQETWLNELNSSESILTLLMDFNFYPWWNKRCHLKVCGKTTWKKKLQVEKKKKISNLLHKLFFQKLFFLIYAAYLQLKLKMYILNDISDIFKHFQTTIMNYEDV